MAVLQFSINSEFHTQCSSGAKFFPAPTSENTLTKRSDCECLYTHSAYLFFLLPPTVKQKQKKKRKKCVWEVHYFVDCKMKTVPLQKVSPYSCRHLG